MIQDAFAISASIKESLLEAISLNDKEVVTEKEIAVMEIGVAFALTDLFCATEKAGGLPKRESAERFIVMLRQMVDETEQQEGDEN